MKRYEEADDPRRRLLIQALAAGFFSAGLPRRERAGCRHFRQQAVQTKKDSTKECRGSIPGLTADNRPENIDRKAAVGIVIELTYNWGVDHYELGSGFGHIAIEVDDVYAACDEIKRRAGRWCARRGQCMPGRRSSRSSVTPTATRSS